MQILNIGVFEDAVHAVFILRKGNTFEFNSPSNLSQALKPGKLDH